MGVEVGLVRLGAGRTHWGGDLKEVESQPRGSKVVIVIGAARD